MTSAPGAKREGAVGPYQGSVEAQVAELPTKPWHSSRIWCHAEQLAAVPNQDAQQQQLVSRETGCARGMRLDAVWARAVNGRSWTRGISAHGGGLNGFAWDKDVGDYSARGLTCERTQK